MHDPTEMARLIAALHTQDGARPTALPGVSLFRVEHEVPRAPVFYEPGIIVLAQGSKTGYFGDSSYIYDPDRYLVMSVPLPFECETRASPDAPLLGVRIDVEIGQLKTLILQMEESRDTMLDTETHPGAPMASVELDAGMRDAVLRLLRMLHDPMQRQILGPQYAREILFRALQGSQGSALRALAGRHGSYGRIARTLRRIHTEYASLLDIDTLAREANMSISAFHHNFKEMTLTSPLQYLKSVRLHKAWLLLVQDGFSVSAAANLVGYESASQFSREFKRYFGRSPALELAATRDMTHAQGSNTAAPIRAPDLRSDRAELA
ncbi:AraC family transcriptional regulator [Paludibacterium yongneupense]|uniref:AraC family transcriptional regulator n=1 Tax=Paludibacterium yongneupense TaxID=400061 RepID=UPI0004273E18|nr:AraC family transcriptional regulator [Paludibacterium yongneupense]